MENNPLVHWTELPAFDKIEVKHFEPAVKDVIGRSEKALTDLEESSPDTWNELMIPLERIDDEISRVWGIISHFHAVKNSPELREVYDPLLSEVITLSNRLGQSKPLYKAYCALRESEEAKSFDSAQQRILESTIHEADLNGVGLNDQDRTRYNEISQRQAELGTKFTNNVLDSTKAYKLKLTDKEDIDGLPSTLLDLAADTAVREGIEDATASEGPWIFTLDFPSFFPFIQHARNRELREKIYRAYITKASEGEFDNTDIIKEIMSLRKEKSQLLGFKSYANMSLSRKMAPDIKTVEKLLIELQTVAHPAALNDLEDLKALAAKLGAPEANELKQWDTNFWAERLREIQYDLKDEELRPYFPLPRVLSGLYELTERLFDVHLEEVEVGVAKWHGDVRYVKVYNKAGAPIASFFLDPYSRPEEKRGGAWMNVLVGRSDIMALPGKDVRLPVAYMMCNQSKPVGGRPSLMTFQEVETLFHEFGHALQHLLTTINYGMASGLANVEWDAVELASQFMENWCYDRGTLKGMAQHFETNEPLPDEMIDRLLAARTFREGSNTLRQVNFGLFDMELHDRYDPDGDESVLDVQRRIDEATVVLPPINEDRFYCSFSHIFSGGYAAGYYSYKWSEVLSADAFSAFIEGGLDNEDSVRSLGRKFRDTILAMGGSVHPMDVFKAFRGREPSTDALLKQMGLKK
jgi:oligopeptidase A